VSDTAPAPVAAVARGGAINLVGAVVYGASNFVVLVVLNHSLGVEQAAVVVVAIALFNVVSTVAALGCTTGLVRTISRLRAIDEPERLHATLRVALGPVLVVSCAAALAVAAAAPALASPSPPSTPSSSRAPAVSTPWSRWWPSSGSAAPSPFRR